MGAENFATWAYSVFKDDPKYNQYLDQLITPSEEAKRKAQISGAAGAAVAHIFGVGWKTLSRATISFKEQSPPLNYDCPRPQRTKQNQNLLLFPSQRIHFR
jgi:hypothetical protein